jgi:hypothetical protein
MLVYTRKMTALQGDGSREAKSEIPTPPARVLELINTLNAAHDEACEGHAMKSDRI